MRRLSVESWLFNNRRWLLDNPSIPITTYHYGIKSSKILLLRDDLINGLWGGNKGRKLDALLPEICCSASNVITYGGLQSAHLSSVAAATASLGARCHLLIREFASSISYVSRSDYSDRSAMVAYHKERLKKELGIDNISVIEEGAFGLSSILGIIRLVHWLSTENGLSPDVPYDIVIDSGTGTSAIGWAVAISLLDLSSWRVTGVMIAQDIEYYQEQERKIMRLVESSSDFLSLEISLNVKPLINWVPRTRPRRFGSIIEGDVEMCRMIARESGMLVDPIWSLAAIEQAKLMLDEDPERKVVVWHTGGSSLTLQGLSQRYPEAFK